MRVLGVSVAVVVVGAALLGAAPARADDDARYALVHGCYALQAPQGTAAKSDDGYRAGAGEPEAFRMQATELGTYLLYGRARDFLAVDDGEVRPAAEPSPRAEWRVDGDEGAFTLTNRGTGAGLRVDGEGRLRTGAASGFALVPAEGCPEYPELGTNTKGRPRPAPFPFARTRGLIDTHVHQMAFPYFGGDVHCGRPWHRYGAPYALQDCPEHEPNGEAAIVENMVSHGTPVGQHDTDGWPTFKGWPNRESMTHEQAYWKWLERAWLGGLRLYTNLYVDNGVLCEIYPTTSTTCDEMDNVRLQVRYLHEMVDYIDAQYGGPGKGFVRIVRNPFQARRVINRGKLALVQGIEVSRLFNCTETNDRPECTREQIDAQFEEFHDAGVRQMELVNKYDNALTGVAGDAGLNGVATNTGNRYETGHYLAMQTCPVDGEHAHDRPQQTLPGTEDTDPLIGATLRAFLGYDTLPVYPPAPHCNIRGLTDLGAYVIRRMMEKGMIFDPDHMSVLGRRQALDLIEAHGYPGVLSSHSWSTPDALPRILRSGGLVTPAEKSPEKFVKAWREIKAVSDPDFLFATGFSTDVHGFATQAGPPSEELVDYPFTSLDGAVELDRQVSGEKAFDVNRDGIAHFGMYPDMVQAVARVGGQEIVEDLLNGTEGYLETWERAVGVPFRRCQSDRESLTRRGLGPLRLRDGATKALKRAGQPDRRAGRRWTFCVRGTRNRGAEVAAALTRKGRVALIASNAAGHDAAGVTTGDRASRARRGSRAFGRGLRVGDTPGRARLVYGLAGGRVRYVAVATSRASRSPGVLRRHLRIAGLR